MVCLGSAVSNLDTARREMVESFMRLPGLGRSRAERIYDAGYTNPGMLRKATLEELIRIPGVGISLARFIKANLDSVFPEEGKEKSVAESGPEASTAGVVIVGAVEEGATTGTGGPSGRERGTGDAGAVSAGGSSGKVDIPSAGVSRTEERGTGERVKDESEQTQAPGQRGFVTSLFGRLLGRAPTGAPKPSEVKESKGTHPGSGEGKSEGEGKEAGSETRGKSEAGEVGDGMGTAAGPPAGSIVVSPAAPEKEGTEKG
ncbi:MAG: helix-hairpin-helix domain-containing protein [Thermoplasmata archaeon]